MKRELTAIAAITLALCLFTACGADTADVSLPPEPTAAPTQTPAVTDTPVETANPDRAVLDECMALVGMDDAASADALGGGELNIAADGETVIGRIYACELFGERVEPSTAYDADGKVGSVTIYLAEPEGDGYLESLTALYGEHTGESEGTSESGSSWVCWDIDGVWLRLVQSYGLCTLDMSPALGG